MWNDIFGKHSNSIRKILQIFFAIPSHKYNDICSVFCIPFSESSSFPIHALIRRHIDTSNAPFNSKEFNLASNSNANDVLPHVTHVLTLGANPTDLAPVNARGAAVKAEAPAIRERAATASFMFNNKCAIAV